MTEKTCIECKGTFPTETFPSYQRKGKVIVRTRCKPCWRAEHARYQRVRRNYTIPGNSKRE